MASQAKKDSQKKSEICIKGLNNLGNTCYLNTALQCLLFCSSFREEVLNNTHIEKTHDAPLIAELRDVYHKLWIEQNHVIPRGLLYVISQSSIGKMIDVKYPNDLHEFLGLFVDALIEENNKIEKNIMKPLFQKILQGTQESFITCSHCGYRSVNKEKFSSLMLSFDATDPSLSYQKGRKCAQELDELLRGSFRDDVIEERTCDNCHQKRNETRKLRLTKSPNVLMLMIKRYNYNGQRINNMLDIPYDLSLCESQFSEKKTRYKICSIACHCGSLENGHYYSLVLFENNWYKIDDDNVYLVDTLPSSSHYYVLFYQKCSK